MKYKTWFYNVEPIANRLPDDCLKIVISYCYDESPYMFLKNHLRSLKANISSNMKSRDFSPTFSVSSYDNYIYNTNCSMNYIIAVFNTFSTREISIYNGITRTHWIYSHNYILKSINYITNRGFSSDTVYPECNSTINWFFDDDNNFVLDTKSIISRV